jgi:hypothetical protein
METYVNNNCLFLAKLDCVKYTMKKLVAVLVASTLLIGLVALSADAKVVKKVVKKPVVVQPVIVPTPMPEPVPAPVVKPVVVKPKPAPAPVMTLGARAGLLAGLPALIGELTIPDTYLAPMLGLSGVSYRVGAFYATGQYTDYPTVGANQTAKIAGANLELVLDIPKDWMGGLDTYVSGGFDYIVKADAGATGGYGLTAGLGVRSGMAGIGLGDLPGIVCLELGYGTLKVTTPDREAVKGINALVGYAIGF